MKDISNKGLLNYSSGTNLDGDTSPIEKFEQILEAAHQFKSSIDNRMSEKERQYLLKKKRDLDKKEAEALAVRTQLITDQIADYNARFNKSKYIKLARRNSIGHTIED